MSVWFLQMHPQFLLDFFGQPNPAIVRQCGPFQTPSFHHHFKTPKRPLVLYFQNSCISPINPETIGLFLFIAPHSGRSWRTPRDIGFFQGGDIPEKKLWRSSCLAIKTIQAADFLGKLLFCVCVPSHISSNFHCQLFLPKTPM